MSNLEYLKETQNTVARNPERAAYDRPSIYAVLDEVKFVNIAFCHDHRPFIVPMSHGRDGDLIYLHGALRGRMMTQLGSGAEIALSATVVDGLVLTRSAFHHSVNFRSIVAFGKGRAVETEDEKRHGLELIVDQMVSGRSAEVRPPNAKELNATSVAVIEIARASLKQRNGPPGEARQDLDASDIWAGIIPVEVHYGTPQPAPYQDTD